MAGYQEIVNFGEFIGYVVDTKTGIKISTAWGKIHYANDGVHAGFKDWLWPSGV